MTSTYYKAFAPRIGIAWSPGSSGKTSIRAGWGLFYNPIEQLVLAQFGMVDCGEKGGGSKLDLMRSGLDLNLNEAIVRFADYGVDADVVDEWNIDV